jgi:AcrR family transcriptional regulator
MTIDSKTVSPGVRRCGRPRRGTEAERFDELIETATQVFLRAGYDGASIDKVAGEAGVSTRTIYERFKNKAELFAAVIERLVERNLEGVMTGEELDRLEPRQALTRIAEFVTGHACQRDASALFRILATEAHRFPDLVAKVRQLAKGRIDALVIGYLRGQARRGTLDVRDPERAGVLFMQMVCAELNECLLFGAADGVSRLDVRAHLELVVTIFVDGTRSRGAASIVPEGPSP